MRTVKRVVFVVAYVLGLLALLEGSARVALSMGHLSNMTRDEDRTWRRKWVTRHKSGLEIYYSFDRFDSTKGWFSRPNLHDTLTFPGKLVSTNSRGFRGTIDYPFEKDPGRTRIATIGDSYTFGDEVNDNETYPFYLQQLAPATEVINLGVHGYANDQMLILLREEGFRYHPDIVVIGFKNTDMSRNLLSFRDYAKPRFKVVDGQLRQVGGDISTPEETLARDWRRSRFLDIVSAIWYDHEVRNGARAVAAQDITGAIFTQMVADVRAHGGQPVLAYIPSRPEVESPSERTPGEQWLLGLCGRIKAHCMSARPALRAVTPIPPTMEEGHWSPPANRVIAGAVLSYLVDSLGVHPGGGGKP